MWRHGLVVFALAAVLSNGRSCFAVPVAATTLSLNSGSVSGTNDVLNSNGYAGTYINVPSTGPVTITVTATGVAGSGPASHLNIVLADTKVGCDLTGAGTCVAAIPSVPAGTYFVRNEYTNDLESTATNTRSLTLNTFDVSGASIISDKTTSTATLNTDALAAADNYIANFRQGAVTLGLSGAATGTSVHVKMTSRAFSFGTNIPGNSVADVNSYIGANPVAGSKADLFQQFINSHFNSVVPSNYGKWGNTEATRDSPLNPNTETMTQVNTVLQYARAHNMTARMHNLIWGDTTSQPSWVATMLNNPNALDAVSGSNPGGSGNVNSAALRDEISERIAYYV
ncbi:MAG TPA: endo-1,4-beta-xylanase, partial [Lacipirellulaceae bacterium]